METWPRPSLLLQLFSSHSSVSQHAATVLLHHPCTPPQERAFLSLLARSCLQRYVLTSHPQLRRHTVRPKPLRSGSLSHRIIPSGFSGSSLELITVISGI